MNDLQSPIAAPCLRAEADQRSACQLGFLEAAAVFIAGVAILQFMYPDSRGRLYGVPEYDSWYHLKMAAMLPDVGFVREFPWLKYVYFRQEGHEFVSHHAGFHVYLAPFVWLSQRLTGDYAAGGRWAISISFGLTLVLLFKLLALERVPWRWMWLLLILVFPTDFLLRHSYIRAISPSLVCMLAVLLFVFQRRPALAGLAVMTYNLLYLGAVIFSPMIVVTFVVASLFGPREERRLEWKIAVWTLAGWCAGVLLYPYREGMMEFLRLQVFGSGLSPDIAVGAEWRSYGEVWEFMGRSAGPLLLAWAVALATRMRLGPVLSARAATLLVLNFVFFFLTIKAQRFIEYWPPICLMSAAYLAAPLLERIRTRALAPDRRGALLRIGGILVFILTTVVLTWKHLPSRAEGGVIREWPTWMLIGGLLLLAGLWRTQVTNVHDGKTIGMRYPFGWLVCCGAFVGATVGLVRWLDLPSPSSDRRLLSEEVAIAVLAGTFLTTGLVAWLHTKRMDPALLFAPAQSGRPRATDIFKPSFAAGGLTVTALTAMVLTTVLSASRLTAADRACWCGYDLPAIRDVMVHLRSISNPGDVVFTDDWDCFPVYFYHNSYNHYIVGLDPKFTQWREPELWARYVKISRGELRDPNVSIALPDGRGGYVNTTIQVRLEDIRDRFGCRFVLVDRDHGGLLRQLLERPDFAKPVYPHVDIKELKNRPYALFRVLDPEEGTVSSAQARASSSGRTRVTAGSD